MEGEGNMATSTVSTKKKLEIFSLDDITVQLVEPIDPKYAAKQTESVLDLSVGKLDATSPLDSTFETIDTLEDSINSVVPKVPIIVDDKLEKIKITVKKKMAKKTVREELKDIHYDEAPELANLENTLILNAEILRLELEKSRVSEKKASNNRIGRNIIVAMFSLLIVFSFLLPYFVEYVL